MLATWTAAALAGDLLPYRTGPADLPASDQRDARELVAALADRGVAARVDGPASALARWAAFRIASGEPPTPDEIDVSSWQIGCPLILDALAVFAHRPELHPLVDDVAARADNGATTLGIGGFGRGRSRVVVVVASRMGLELDPVPRPSDGPTVISGAIAGIGQIEAAWLPGPERAVADMSDGRFHLDLPPGVTAVDLLVHRGNLVIEAGRLDLVEPPAVAAGAEGDPEAEIRDAVAEIREAKGLPALLALPFAPCGDHPDNLDGVPLSRTQDCYTVAAGAGALETWSILSHRPNAVWQLVDPRFDALGVVVGDGILGFHLYERFTPADAGSVSAALADRLGASAVDPAAEAAIHAQLGAFSDAVIEVAAERVKSALLAAPGPFSPPAERWRVATLHAATVEALADGWPADWPPARRAAIGYTTGRLASGENRHVAVVVVEE